MVMALATLLATRLLVTQDRFLTLTKTERELLQARQLVQGGVDWARAVLLEDMRSSSVDHLDEPWAREVPVIEAEGGQLSGRLRDAQSRFNINNLIGADGNSVDRDMLLAYMRLLSAVQIDSALGPRLAERMLQASRRATASLDPKMSVPRQSSFSLADLAQTMGYAADVVDRLQPYLVALPARTAINVNTADAVVLSAVADLSPLEAAKAVELRQHHWFADTADFANRVNPRATARQLWATQSSYFEAQVTARYGDVRVMTSTLLCRQLDQGRVSIIATQYGGSSEWPL
jgi:general secretion pathway protein K